MVLLAAFEVLLYRYTGETDIAVGTPIANRTRREIEGLVGFFVNTLVLRNASLRAPVRSRSCGGCGRRRSPPTRTGGPLREAGRGAAARAGGPPFPFFQSSSPPEHDPPSRHLPGLTLTPLTRPRVGAKFELSLSVVEAEEGGLVCGVEYGRELFDPSTIDRLLGHLTHLLTAFVATPERAVGELPLLGGEERHQLLAEWNDTTESCRRRLSSTVGSPRWRRASGGGGRAVGSRERITTPSSTAARAAGPAPVAPRPASEPRSGLPRALARDGGGVSPRS